MKDNFLKGIIKENPIFISLLSLCPALAITSSMEAALGMGMLVFLTLLFTNAVISLTAPFISREVKIPAYITIIATVVTIIRMLTQAFLPELASSLGTFIALIVANCIILGRAESYASKNKVIPSIVDGAGMGIGFTFALLVISFFREFLGTGGFSFGNILSFMPDVNFHPFADYAIPLFVENAGAFLTLSLILAVIAYYTRTKMEKIEALKVTQKNVNMKEAK